MKTSSRIVTSLVFLSSAISCSDLPSNVVTIGGYPVEIGSPKTLNARSQQSATSLSHSDKILADISYDEEGLLNICYWTSHEDYYNVTHVKNSTYLQEGSFGGSIKPDFLKTEAEVLKGRQTLEKALALRSARTAELRGWFQTTRIPDEPGITAEIFRSKRKLVVVHGVSHVTVYPYKFIHQQEKEEDICSPCSIS